MEREKERERSMARAEVAFFPAPGMGHQVPMVELAKLIASRDHRVSITVFLMHLPFYSKINSYTHALLSDQPPPRVRFIGLTLDEPTSEYLRCKPRTHFMPELVRVHMPRVKHLISTESTRRVSCFVLDLCCTPFMDVAAELGAPSYVFSAMGAGTLALMLHLQSLLDEQNLDVTVFSDADTESRVPGFVNPIPSKVLPSVASDKESAAIVADVPRRLRKVKGILVNTFAELEPHPIKCLYSDHTVPSIHTVGPILNLEAKKDYDEHDLHQYNAIMAWLDNQPPSSVVYLCFGSMGTFDNKQIVEIARALEQCGHRFLWSLRRPPPTKKLELPKEFEDFSEVLPERFLDRTKETGKVIGWSPQLAVLSHVAVGGFVSHCGWNSTLESLWCGVPLATWPIDSDQQMNAFEMVRELELAVEIKLDCRKMEEKQVIVTAEEINRGIKQLMEGKVSTEIRKKVKMMKEKSRKTVQEGGSSHIAIGNFIQGVINN